jgi:hypothetical protein
MTWTHALAFVLGFITIPILFALWFTWDYLKNGSWLD